LSSAENLEITIQENHISKAIVEVIMPSQDAKVLAPEPQNVQMRAGQERVTL